VSERDRESECERERERERERKKGRERQRQRDTHTNTLGSSDADPPQKESRLARTRRNLSKVCTNPPKTLRVLCMGSGLVRMCLVLVSLAPGHYKI